MKSPTFTWHHKADIPFFGYWSGLTTGVAVICALFTREWPACTVAAAIITIAPAGLVYRRTLDALKSRREPLPTFDALRNSFLLGLTFGILAALVAALILPGIIIAFISLCLAAPILSDLFTIPSTKTTICTTCSYDLRAHKPNDRCPECGSIYSPSQPQNT
jgi:hypothetical protein